MRWRDLLGVGERRWKKAPDEEVQPAKTLWDWLQLLIVPAILVGVTFAWSASQTRSDNSREDRRIAADRAAAEEVRQDATLQRYLDQMSGLMLERNLLHSKPGDEVQALAHTLTLTALRRLDGDRKGEVVQFLYGAKLLQGSARGLPPVSLFDADLKGVNLQYAVLSACSNDRCTRQVGPNLERANLAHASFAAAQLGGTDFAEADLSGADLSGANMVDAEFQAADLRGADFSHSNLTNANLTLASLEDANLEGAHGLALNRYLTDTMAFDPSLTKSFLDNQAQFLGSLTRKELAKFGLSPEKLVRFRKKASSGS